ncbi:hypothetical protein PLICRDRAFT_44219 [Plicaturopsis crispa FD-325 SS-3]|nr:hypothetical protein PLICRDRAFT_44219 [Plicaturopsis crispa FD-325 SS-3]
MAMRIAVPRCFILMLIHISLLADHIKQQTPAMSPSHTFSVGAVSNPLSMDDDDDNDICPVCDGECTCGPLPSAPKNSSNSNGYASARPVASTPISNPSPAPAAAIPSLKIKLTVPPSMLKRHSSGPTVQRAPLPKFKKYKHDAPSTSLGASGSNVSLDVVPRKRGRPPKYPKPAANPTDSTVSTPSQIHRQAQTARPRKTEARPKPAPKAAKSKGKGTTVKKAPAKKRVVVSSEEESSESDDDIDDIDDDDDGRSVQFPTFVSASAMSSSEDSDSSSSSSSGFDSDSSIEAEEETYILTEERREKARTLRELMGEDGAVHKRRDPNTNWIIRPRKRSVGLSDVDMDDSDATEDDEEEEEKEEVEEEAEDEADEEDVEPSIPGAGYAGVATGWSDDEESSFDADLFFANLTDSGDNSSSSGGGDDGYQTDKSMSAAAAEDGPPAFEVCQGWDGQIVFTNGVMEGRGVLDMDFEASAAQLVVDDSASPSQESDVEMQTSEDFEYEEDGLDLNESDGETTEDELVGENGLPTQRAMMLFRWPTSVSAINPLSTVSPPGRSHRRNFSGGSPRPADILAGRIFWEDSDEHDQADNDDSVSGSRSVVSSSRGVPTMGQFQSSDGPQRSAVISGSCSSLDIPSPYPRTRKNRNRSDSRTTLGSMSEAELRGRAISRSSPAPGAIQLPPSDDLLAQVASDLPTAEPIDLDDVLDSSFLEPDPFDPTLSSTSSEAETRQHLQDLSRWDRIPMGTFRRTRESATITGDATDGAGPSGSGNENRLKASPFSSMYDKRVRPRSKSNISVNISPVLLPIRDGDRTPTNAVPDTPPNETNSSGSKTRREIRREKKMKRKNFTAPAHHQHPHHQHRPVHQQRHFHQHHPNRTSSMQRTNFFGSAGAAPPPLNL